MSDSSWWFRQEQGRERTSANGRDPRKCAALHSEDTIFEKSPVILNTVGEQVVSELTDFNILGRRNKLVSLRFHLVQKEHIHEFEYR